MLGGVGSDVILEAIKKNLGINGVVVAVTFFVLTTRVRRVDSMDVKCIKKTRQSLFDICDTIFVLLLQIFGVLPKRSRT